MLFKFLRQLSQRIVHFWQQNFSPKLLPLLSTIRIVGLVVAGLSLWAFAAIAQDVLEKETHTLDTSILLSIRRLHTPLWDQVMVGITFLGEPIVLLIIGFVVGIGLLIKDKKAQATTLAIAATGAVALNYLLKDLFARDRPALWERIVDVGSYSFPSGHAMISLVVYGMIGYLLAILFRRWQKSVLFLTILLINSIGLSRLYLGVHWPTDVVAGYAAGLVWLVTCILSLEVWRQRNSFGSIVEQNSKHSQ